MTLFMTSYFKNKFENDVITTDMKSARIHLLNFYSFRHTQPFYFQTNRIGQLCRSWSYLFAFEIKGQRRNGIMNVRDTSSHGDTRMC